MFVDQLLVYGANNVQVDLNRIEIQKRHAKFVRGRYCNSTGFGELGIYEVGNQRQLFLFGSNTRLGELLFRDDSILNEASRQACKIGP